MASSKPYAGQPALSLDGERADASQDVGAGVDLTRAHTGDSVVAQLQRRELQEIVLARGFKQNLAAQMQLVSVKHEPSPRDWMGTAEDEIGVREIAGRRHSQRVLQYHDATRLNANADETSWCAAFVSWVLQTSSLPSPRTALASDYLAYGVPISTPCYGAIGVVRMYGANHVGFVVQADAQFVSLLGGNQSNAVNVARFPRSAFRGFRFPPGVPMPDVAAPDDDAPSLPADLPVLGADETR